MAIPFREPNPPLRIRSADEIAAIDAHFMTQNVPVSSNNRLLLASWNIANLGVQERSRGVRKALAHIMKRFDLIAV